jgi:ATP synthase protein I
MSDPAPDPDKLRALGERLDKARGVDRPAQQSRPSPFGFVLRLSTELVLALFVGAAMGWGIDWLFGWFGWNTRPVFIVIMSLFGAAAGIRNVFRMARRLNAQDEAARAAAPSVQDREDD